MIGGKAGSRGGHGLANELCRQGSLNGRGSRRKLTCDPGPLQAIRAGSIGIEAAVELHAPQHLTPGGANGNRETL